MRVTKLRPADVNLEAEGMVDIGRLTALRAAQERPGRVPPALAGVIGSPETEPQPLSTLLDGVDVATPLLSQSLTDIPGSTLSALRAAGVCLSSGTPADTDFLNGNLDLAEVQSIGTYDGLLVRPLSSDERGAHREQLCRQDRRADQLIKQIDTRVAVSEDIKARLLRECGHLHDQLREAALRYANLLKNYKDVYAAHRTLAARYNRAIGLAVVSSISAGMHSPKTPLQRSLRSAGGDDGAAFPVPESLEMRGAVWVEAGCGSPHNSDAPSPMALSTRTTGAAAAMYAAAVEEHYGADAAAAAAAAVGEDPAGSADVARQASEDDGGAKLRKQQVRAMEKLRCTVLSLERQVESQRRVIDMLTKQAQGQKTTSARSGRGWRTAKQSASRDGNTSVQRSESGIAGTGTTPTSTPGPPRQSLQMSTWPTPFSEAHVASPVVGETAAMASVTLPPAASPGLPAAGSMARSSPAAEAPDATAHAAVPSGEGGGGSFLQRYAFQFRVEQAERSAMRLEDLRSVMREEAEDTAAACGSLEHRLRETTAALASKTAQADSLVEDLQLKAEQIRTLERQQRSARTSRDESSAGGRRGSVSRRSTRTKAIAKVAMQVRAKFPAQMARQPTPLSAMETPGSTPSRTQSVRFVESVASSPAMSPAVRGARGVLLSSSSDPLLVRKMPSVSFKLPRSRGEEERRGGDDAAHANVERSSGADAIFGLYSEEDEGRALARTKSEASAASTASVERPPLHAGELPPRGGGGDSPAASGRNSGATPEPSVLQSQHSSFAFLPAKYRGGGGSAPPPVDDATPGLFSSVRSSVIETPRESPDPRPGLFDPNRRESFIVKLKHQRAIDAKAREVDMLHDQIYVLQASLAVAAAQHEAEGGGDGSGHERAVVHAVQELREVYERRLQEVRERCEQHIQRVEQSTDVQLSYCSQLEGRLEDAVAAHANCVGPGGGAAPGGGGYDELIDELRKSREEAARAARRADSLADLLREAEAKVTTLSAQARDAVPIAPHGGMLTSLFPDFKHTVQVDRMVEELTQTLDKLSAVEKENANLQQASRNAEGANAEWKAEKAELLSRIDDADAAVTRAKVESTTHATHLAEARKEAAALRAEVAALRAQPQRSPASPPAAASEATATPVPDAASQLETLPPVYNIVHDDDDGGLGSPTASSVSPGRIYSVGNAIAPRPYSLVRQDSSQRHVVKGAVASVGKRGNALAAAGAAERAAGADVQDAQHIQESMHLLILEDAVDKPFLDAAREEVRRARSPYNQAARSRQRRAASPQQSSRPGSASRVDGAPRAPAAHTPPIPPPAGGFVEALSTPRAQAGTTAAVAAVETPGRVAQTSVMPDSAGRTALADDTDEGFDLDATAVAFAGGEVDTDADDADVGTGTPYDPEAQVRQWLLKERAAVRAERREARHRVQPTETPAPGEAASRSHSPRAVDGSTQTPGPMLADAGEDAGILARTPLPPQRPREVEVMTPPVRVAGRSPSPVAMVTPQAIMRKGLSERLGLRSPEPNVCIAAFTPTAAAREDRYAADTPVRVPAPPPGVGAATSDAAVQVHLDGSPLDLLVHLHDDPPPAPIPPQLAGMPPATPQRPQHPQAVRGGGQERRRHTSLGNPYRRAHEKPVLFVGPRDLDAAAAAVMASPQA